MKSESTDTAFSSLTVASRTINGTLFVLAGAIVAGIGQLAGGGALTSQPAPNAIAAALILAGLSIAVGVGFLLWSFEISRGKHGWKTVTQLENMRTGWTKDVDEIEDEHETELKLGEQARAWVLGQLGLWLLGAVFYGFVIFHVTR